MKNKYLSSILLGAAIALSGCNHKEDAKPDLGCKVLSNLEITGRSNKVSSEAISLARKYDESAHRLQNTLKGRASKEELLSMYGTYVTNSFNLTLFGSKNRSDNYTEFIMGMHQHVFEMGIDSNTNILNLRN